MQFHHLSEMINLSRGIGQTHYIFYYIIPCCLFIMLLIINVLLRWLFSCLYNILSQLLQNDNF